MSNQHLYEFSLVNILTKMKKGKCKLKRKWEIKVSSINVTKKKIAEVLRVPIRDSLTMCFIGGTFLTSQAGFVGLC